MSMALNIGRLEEEYRQKQAPKKAVEAEASLKVAELNEQLTRLRKRNSQLEEFLPLVAVELERWDALQEQLLQLIIGKLQKQK